MKTVTSLFSDIADAIREKSGSIDKIRALDMPEKILSIQGSSGDINYQSGTYIANDSIRLINSAKYYDQCITIQHNLGRVPTTIFFGINEDSEFVPVGNELMFVTGINTEKVNEIISKNQYGVKYINSNGAKQGVFINSSDELQMLVGDEKNIYIHGINIKEVVLRAGIKYTWVVV